MVWYRVGSADEPQGKSGIAHFLEHLMFKGTDKIAPGDFSKIVARIGGQDNAFTSTDITAYFQRVAKEKLAEVMRMEADRMVNLRLDDQNVLTERKVILEERRGRVDNDPSAILSEQMLAALYTAHPYGIPVIGWQPEIEQLNRADALAFYKRFYAPNNAILIVAGDVEPDAVVTLAREIYGKSPANPAVTQRVRPVEPEPVAERRIVLRDGRAGRATLQRYYIVPSYRTGDKREAAALQILAQIVGASNTSRLYNTLVKDRKLAANASGWYTGMGLDSGRFGVYAIAAGDKKLEEIEAAMDEVIDSVIESGVSEAEFERARNAEIADLIYDADSQSTLARQYGWALATGLTVQDVESREARLKAVTLADIQAVARKYLDKKRSVTGYLIPIPSQLAKTQTLAPNPGGIIQ
jgi:zinc protease